MRLGLIAGVNVDRLNIAVGMRELVACGYPVTETERHFVIQYALQRWARGEEEAAQRGAIDKSFHGISLTCLRTGVMASGNLIERIRFLPEQGRYIEAAAAAIVLSETADQPKEGGAA